MEYDVVASPAVMDLVCEERGVETKVARMGGEVVVIPNDLYIPPDALHVFLEAFEGPLDLLLYLIKKQNLDILNIPIADITRQYIRYIELMRELKLELAAEYLVMAAFLAEIKSRLLLPKPENIDHEEAPDPRAELVARLQAYEAYRQAAEDLDQLPRLERDTYVAEALLPQLTIPIVWPTVVLPSLLQALGDVLKRAELYQKHQIIHEPLSIRERMSQILSQVSHAELTDFSSLFCVAEGRMGVVVTLIAVLELVRQSVLDCQQGEPYAPLYVRMRGGA